MERSVKEALVVEYKDIFSELTAAVLVDSQGMKMNKLVELRKELNKVSSKMLIVKNTLTKRAIQGTPFEPVEEHFVEARAIVFSNEDPVGQAKVLSQFAKDNKSLEIKVGILSDKGKVSILSVEQVQALAKLPPKEDLIAKLLFLFTAPATQFVRTLSAVPSTFVRTLSAIADSKKE